MRGVPIIRISRYRKLFDRSTLIHTMFFMVKLVCYCEMAMRLALPYVMPIPIGRTLRLTLSHLIRLYERVLRTVIWYVIPIKLKVKVKPLGRSPAGPHLSSSPLLYVGIRTKHGNSKDYVLQIVANLYGQKQGGRVWNQYLVDKLKSLGFDQSLVDECVFYRGSAIFILYVDDGIVLVSTRESW